jgi:hypothetical protein
MENTGQAHLLEGSDIVGETALSAFALLYAANSASLPIFDRLGLPMSHCQVPSRNVSIFKCD